MTLFDLLFIALFLTAVVTLLIAVIAAVRGDGKRARRLLTRLAIVLAAYMIVVYAVALASSAQVLAIDEDKCSDDWCIAVTSVQQRPDTTAGVYDVTLRLSSRARRITQRERGVAVYLRDAKGHLHLGESGPTDSPFDVRLGPLASILTHRRFVMPPDALGREIVISHDGFPFPGCCIIGEATELVHPPVVRIP